MTSERLEDLVVISAEKTVGDAVDIESVTRFAGRPRGLPLKLYE